MMTWTLVSRSPCFGIILDNLDVREIPPKRLIDNIQAYIKKRPKDAEAHYELGRVYSVLYTANRETILTAFKDFQGKRFPFSKLEYWYGAPVEPGSFKETPPPPKSKREEYLLLSLKSYRKALDIVGPNVNADSEDAERYPLYLLGYGWMLEQGKEFAETLPAPFKLDGALRTKEEWRNEALDTFRNVYTNYRPVLEPEELGLLNFILPAQEAATSIIRLLKGNNAPQALAEVARLRYWLDSAKKLRNAVSPVIFPLNGRDTLSQLLAPRKAVRFDLMGDRTGTRWSWVNERAGILVWDPLHNGRVRSGYQLFGNVTWCMIWKHGYAPLARLDANGDGWLTGKELEGIAVWQDKNGNGVSDRGEVIPLSRLGIARISVKALQGGDGIFWNPRGIVKRDGTAIPTYDWIAKEAK